MQAKRVIRLALRNRENDHDGELKSWKLLDGNVLVEKLGLSDG